jgi:glutamate dehydrogenase/leucine dehydrogenase
MEGNYFSQFADEWGPAKIVHLYEPRLPLHAIVVIDNTALGPAVGGVRMAPDVTTEEIFRLARTMTWKNAAAGLPHGGAKAGIIANPAMPLDQKERLIRAFAQAIADLTQYIPGPDMGTDETCMAFIYDENQRSTGRPKVTGGIPLDELGATGFGLAVAAEQMAGFLSMSLLGARVAIQGFGSVGKATAKFLEKRGCVLVAASDSAGAIYNPQGINYAQLAAIKERNGKVQDYSEAGAISPEALFTLPCEIIVPAARPDAITMENAPNIQAKIILQGANIPIELEAEKYLHGKGICTLPDFIVNAGGVISTAVEYRHGSSTEAFGAINDKIQENCQAVLNLVKEEKLYPRAAAHRLAQNRVKEAMRYQRHF